LAEFLLEKKYIVYGIIRRSSSLNTERIHHIYVVTDSLYVNSIIAQTKPDVILKFQNIANVDALGTLRILESIR
jgi:GDPmannose 4,6-dehydratase